MGGEGGEASASADAPCVLLCALSALRASPLLLLLRSDGRATGAPTGVTGGERHAPCMAVKSLVLDLPMPDGAEKASCLNQGPCALGGDWSGERTHGGWNGELPACALMNFLGSRLSKRNADCGAARCGGFAAPPRHATPPTAG